MKYYSSVLFCCLLFSTGCASILKGSKQSVNVNSNVDEAEVHVNGRLVGQTPFSGTIERASTVQLTVKKHGYKSRTITLDTGIEPVFWVNIFIGGVFGSTTDLATGSMWKVSPNTYNVDLKPIDSSMGK